MIASLTSAESQVLLAPVYVSLLVAAALAAAEALRSLRDRRARRRAAKAAAFRRVADQVRRDRFAGRFGAPSSQAAAAAVAERCAPSLADELRERAAGSVPQ